MDPDIPHNTQPEPVNITVHSEAKEDALPPPAMEEHEDIEADSNIHGFLNVTNNITVIEQHLNNSSDSKKQLLCEGSDSGVEIAEAIEYQRALSSNSGVSQDFENICAQSCDSSIISCCSNYEEAYNLLVRKNSTLLEDYTLRNGDVTSENGSESSSLSGSQSRCRRSTLSSAKKKILNSNESKKTPTTTIRDRSKSKPPATPLRTSSNPSRLKSLDRLQSKTAPTSRTSIASSRSKPVPNNLDLNRKDSVRKTQGPRSMPPTCLSRTSTQATPTEDNRWSSKTSSAMTRSLRVNTEHKSRISHTDSKTIEKYATLPRRKKEKDKVTDEKKVLNPSTTINKKSSKENTPSRMFSSLYVPKNKAKTKIYHEMNIQTALTMCDINKALNGAMVSPKDPQDIDQCTKEVQVDIHSKEMEKLKNQLRNLTEKYDSLLSQHKDQTEKLNETESRLKAETLEKKGLREELNNNSQRVLAILGQAENTEATESSSSNDSLLVLENRFQNVSQVIIQQEEEIAKLNNYCRSFQIDLEKSLAAQKTLLQQHQDLEAESIELQEFLQAEKTTLADALKEAEGEIKRYQQVFIEKDKEIAEQQEECKQLARLSEQRRLEKLGLQARIGNLEAKSRELLVHQGSSVSGASVALASLIQRLSGLVDELVAAYNISDQELEDVIYHNEAYNNSSSSVESTPEKSRLFTEDKQSPNGKGSSFVSAVINAIKNAASGKDLSRKDSLYDRSSSNEMLDSETEPCLMMEHVLEDVVVPDGHSHNMISSGHGSMLSSRLTHSESLKDVSNIYLSRQCSEPTSLNTSFTSDIFSLSEFLPPISLVDQVIDVDNVITRLLKVIRIIQIENDDCMNELQDQRDSLTEQVDKQKETNKLVVKQLKDWEVLGARLKSEVKELMSQLSRKNTEMDGVKSELNKQREEVEKLNQDVCDLSTVLSKAELEMRVKEEDVDRQIGVFSDTGEMPSEEVLARLIITQNEVPSLKEKITEKDKRLNELNQEFLASKQVLTESLKDAMNETKRQL
ncbi:myosin-15-like [Sitophilus oryzae]|uniref:Myosin-15-like n=1 Tax=Sitophilus oryzae TaxID=7048 RepID=A0A6J2YYS1_SITOR|nr:myosin-15-like [Sitophilus oryzae]XP_030768386.1 myosin-15-like [Sitophilus oryzae]XP_030768387.1 myosin-15-like [Sitophilus oryzae]XP_030768389.1 myosin-15-like [Sitophilus oryzae]